MRKFFTLTTFLFISFMAMAQSQFFYEWKNNVITIRTTDEVDKFSFPQQNEVAVFSTGSPTSLTGNSMIASYSIVISGVFPENNFTSEMGVCYSSTSPTPSIEDSHVKYGAFEEGTWEVTLTNLDGATQYHYCPYMKVGDIVYYGPTKSFTTLQSSTSSLWDLLESRNDLSKFREIVGKTRYYLTESQPAYTLNGTEPVYYTFKDVLKANTHMTLWAPTNSALSDEEWAKFTSMAETDGYQVQLRLIGNHMAMGSKTMGASGLEKIILANEKNAMVNYTESKFQNSQIIEENISAYNGVMHIINNENEFRYNIYDYIKYGGEADRFHNYVVKREVINDAKCILDENGNPIYTFSPQNNMMFVRRFENPTDINAEDAWMSHQKMFAAAINNEDSAFVMIIPTDLAWADAVERLRPFYKYVSTYPRMDKVSISTYKDRTSDIFGARRSYANGMGYETIDSLQLTNIETDIIYPLVFNINLQPRINGQAWTAESFVNGGYKECPYLLTTTGDTIRDAYEDINGTRSLVWKKDWLFEGEGIRTQKAMTNGYAFVTDKWNYPRNYWRRDIDIDAHMGTLYDKASSTNLTQYDIKNSTAKSWIDQYGRCSEQNYAHVAASSSSTNPEAAFRLQGCKQGDADVISGKYDVQIVLVPRWYEDSGETPEIPENVLKNRLVCTLYYWDESLIGGNDLKYNKQKNLVSTDIEYSGEKVDTITVMTDVEFPVSYKNILEAYPVLHIKSNVKTADVKKGYSRTFNIDRIILKSKESE